MRLSEVSWADAAAATTDLALLPVGSTEQHGPHAPLGTDALVARAIADRGASRYGEEVILAPGVPVGVAEEHRQFPGTLWVSEDTFRAYVRETIESLAAHGWPRVVVVNGHGGNVPALREVCAGVTRAGDAYAVPFTWFDALDTAAIDGVPDGDLAMGHGGPLETSLIRHLAADLVQSERFDAASDGAADRWGEWVAGTNLAYDAADFTESGVVGDPAQSDPAIGEALLDAAADALVELLQAVSERDIDREAD